MHSDAQKTSSVSLASYVEHVADRYGPVTWIDDLPWQVIRGKLTPLAMPHVRRPVDPQKIRSAMAETCARVAVWSDQWDTAPCQWWWLCCDDPTYDISHIPKRGKRKDVRRGLDRCEVRRIDADLFAEHGYAVYEAAFEHYGAETTRISADAFAQDVLQNAEYPGRETWGAFVADKLVAYITCVIVDDAVGLSAGKSDLAYRNAQPNNALIYTLTQHYLTERGLRYATGGERVLLHESNIQDFLEMLGYRRVYCPLRAIVHPALSAVVSTGVARWGKYLGLGKVFPGPMGKLHAVAELIRIARACENVGSGGEEPVTQDDRAQADGEGE